MDSEQQYILNSFNDGSSSTFSLPNLWDSSADPKVQHFGDLRSWAFRMAGIERSGSDVIIEWNDILGFARNGVIPWYLTDADFGGISYVVEWSTDMITWNQVDVGTDTSWTDSDTAGYTIKYYRIRLNEPSI